jgi:hypothetical protein
MKNWETTGPALADEVHMWRPWAYAQGEDPKKV